MTDLTHLHVHDAWSLLDSSNRVEELVARARELGMKALAITNHGNMYSAINFYKEAKNHAKNNLFEVGKEYNIPLELLEEIDKLIPDSIGLAKAIENPKLQEYVKKDPEFFQELLTYDIKPIIGCELYVCDDMKVKDPKSRYDHIIVLAKNEIGYKNILKLSSMGYLEGFYYKPRIDMKTLEENKEGLIIMTACLGGEIPRMIMNPQISDDDIERKLTQYKETFPDFYLEIQSANNIDQEKVNKALAKFSVKLGIPLVATSDIHFLKKEDFDLHGVFIQINQDRDNEVYQDCWMKSEEEMMEVLTQHIDFFDAIEAVANTSKIADMCNLEIELGKSYLPHFPIPEQYKNEDDYLRHLINVGFKKRGLNELDKETKQVYINRLKEEYDIITAKGFSGYFLIVQDFLEECKRRNILTGDGRGSADNSLVCYVLGITNVDPILYDLNFSRFLTIERVELPDIDMDIQSSHKQEAVNILREKYKKVAQICTFGGLQSKAIFDALGRVLGIPYDVIANIKKHIPDGIGLEKALQRSSALKLLQQQYPKLFEYALRLEGLPRSISVHAGGVVICPLDKEMNEFTALGVSSDGEVITQLEMHNVEQVGLVKMDCLGIITLDVISDTLDLVYGEE